MKNCVAAIVALFACLSLSRLTAQPAPPEAPGDKRAAGAASIETNFENASPLRWEVDAAGAVQLYPVYDQERGSPNRANGHWHFRIRATPGSKVTVVVNNLDNVWNGKHASPVSGKTISFVSADGRTWRAMPGRALPGHRMQLAVEMQGPQMYVARLEPYRLSDLEKLLASLRDDSRVQITRIGKTVEGRDLEIVRVGNPEAPYRVLLRARAHAWEPGGNWVVQGLIRRLLRDDEEPKRDLARYCVYVLPMANKDGVAHGRTRFNMMGKDLNREWDRPADPKLAPENAALEAWIESMIKKGERPDLALDLHNDEGGLLHISRPDATELTRYLTRMRTFEGLLRQHTWFTEGSTSASFHNPGTIGDGLLARYGIDAAVHELNGNWIAGLHDYPSARNWELYGEQLCRVFYEYFGPARSGLK
jgi:hypothetical protein